ncbi:transmembrane channel-like protein 8 isoform X2 [Meles meles]|uniref:transmembrane channel-like protein 8 isoform X2 n=1 Tax=Meles meles TaxID=9662 RepID=UPI001E69BCE7|nr:transmembrane channel-like protein 8 isoform X2 [Meles meles]
MLRQWSVQSGQALVEPEPEPGVEELWEQEMERLWSSQAQVRELPYAMLDKRFIRQLREPKGVKTSCWQRRQRRWRTVRRRLGEAAQRLARGFGLWEGALYEIGGLFGTGIQSYFTFLRFLLLLNLLTLLLTAGFVLLPLVWLRPPDTGPSLNFTLECPGGLQPQTGVPRFHNRLWNVLTGRAFGDSYLFYGAYRAGPEGSSAYSIRLAYLLSPLACLLLCLCGILQRMVKGLPQRLFLGQDYKSPVSVKVFSSWDFCTRGQEAATIKKHEISNEFKVELEERRRFLLVQQETRAQRACHLLSHLRVNVLVGLLVVGAITAIFWATKYSQDNKEESLFVVLQYLPPGVIALVNFLGPLLFVSLIQLENYPPNTEVNLALIWCVVLKLASLGMFSFSLGQTVLCLGRNKTSCASYGYNACDYQCWENAVGEELYKLSIFNFLLMVAFAFFVSLPRRLLVERFSGRFWTWLDREEFLVPKNVLDIVAGQTVTWMGLFYCPLLPLLNSVFIFLTFYIKKYTLLRNSRASPRRFRASSSTFFFQLVLLLGLLLAVMPLGYVVSSLVLTVCVSQSQANARAIQGLRKQLVWQVQEKWHLVEDLSRLLPEKGSGGSMGPESPPSGASRPRSFCPGFPCPGSPGPRAPRPGPCFEDPARPGGGPVATPRFRFPSGSEL